MQELQKNVRVRVHERVLAEDHVDRPRRLFVGVAVEAATSNGVQDHNIHGRLGGANMGHGTGHHVGVQVLEQHTWH